MKTTLRTVLWAAVAGSLLAAPFAFAQNFNALPKSGKAASDAWPGYFWSYFGGQQQSGFTGIAGGLAWRFQGAQSPAEKFDIAFGNKDKLAAAMPKILAFGLCAEKAKKSCFPAAGATHRMNQDCLKKTEIRNAYAACVKPPMDTVTAWEVVNQGIGKLDADFWWGICHGWAAAAALFKEPVKDVTHNGVTFTPGDIKAYAAVAGTDVDLAPGGWFGSRYDGAKDYDFDTTKNDPALNDITPRQYHNAMGKVLGAGKGLVVDRYTGGEVWNQPADRFETTCLAAGAGCAAGEQAQTCKTAFTWAEDGDPSAVANGNRSNPHHYTTRNLSYTICVKGGEITGEGKWNHDPNAGKNNLHPDFIWVPGALRSGSGASNPMIATRLAEWKKLLADPSAGISTGGGSITPEKVVKVNVNKAIPDMNTTGVTATGSVAGTGKITTFSTCLNITHAYKDDLVCTTTFGGKTATVWNKERTTQPCVSHTSFTGLPASGTVSVNCKDVVQADVGQWASFEIRFTSK